MQSLLQILKVNEIREGKAKSSGNPYRMQDCECILLNEDGTPSTVGVLMLPKALTGNVQPGLYSGTFALSVDFSSRRIGAALTGLTPIPPGALKPAKVS